MDAANKKLLIASGYLADKYPRYYYFLTFMRYNRDDNIPTMGVSPKYVLSYNFDFVMKLSDDELRGTMMHEIMHCILRHHKRFLENPHFGEVGHIIHNIAADMEINSRPEQLGNYKLPKDAVYPKTFRLPDGKVTNYPDGLCYEDYLNLLIKDLRNLPPQYFTSSGEGDSDDGNEGNNSDDSSNGNSDGKDGSKSKSGNSKKNSKPAKLGSKYVKGLNGEEDVSDMDEHTADSDSLTDTLEDKGMKRESSMGQGNGSDASSHKREVEIKKYPWANIFKNTISRLESRVIAGYEFVSYAYMNRHNPYPEKYIIPAWKSREFTINLIIIMDVSGSMSEIIDEMYARMRSITKNVSGTINTTILEVDTDVVNVIKNYNLDSKVVKSTDGGGTDLRAGWKYIKDHNMKFDLIMCMSDGYTDWPAKDDPYFFGNKSICILSDTSNDCPYKVYYTDY